MKGTVYMDKSKIRQLADYAVRQCCDNSENCYWSVSYDELYHHFGAEVTDNNENGRLLEEELRQRTRCLIFLLYRLWQVRVSFLQHILPCSIRPRLWP